MILPLQPAPSQYSALPPCTRLPSVKPPMPFHVDSSHGPSEQGTLPKGGFATGTLKTESTSLKEVLLFHVLSLLVFAIPLQLKEPTATALSTAAVEGGPAGTIVWLE